MRASSTTSTFGIFQSDIIIRTALKTALADVRAKPYLLNYAFASLPKDTLTAADYGQSELERAKAWFLQNEIDVRLNVKGEPPSFPCITLALLESGEVAAEATLGEFDSEVSEPNDGEWPTLAGPFTPLYDQSTGTVTLPPSLAGVPLFAGMALVDKTETSWSILDVLDDTHFTIAPGLYVDFADATLRAPAPALTTLLGSASFRETYSIGIHAHGEAVYTIYLHSIVVFCLLRYRKTLLEARGFGRSTMSSSDLKRNDQVESTENVFSRFMSLQGYVRNWWPKEIGQNIVGADVTVYPAGLPAPDLEDDERDMLGGTP